MNQQKKQSRIFESITVLQRKHYGCLAKIFCCKCIHCCQDFDFSLLTSENRKSVFQKMIKRYIKNLHQSKKLSVIMDPFFILVALLLGEESQTYTELMSIINNQSEPAIFSKEDLQFYIPELCTYLVFHQELKNIELEKLLVRACKVDIHFSLKYYFYMKSLEVMNIGNEEVRTYERVSKYNCQFRNMINHYYKINKNDREVTSMINPIKYNQQQDKQNSIIIENKNNSEGQQKQNIRQSCTIMHNSTLILKKKSESQIYDKKQFKYEETLQLQPLKIAQKIQLNKIRFLQQTNIYEPFISKPTDFTKGIFESTVNFFSDLTQLSKILLSSSNRKQQLKQYLQQVNKRLPATVYIPFTKDCYQDLNIINIVFDQARVFNTKQRAPFYICLESFYNPTLNQGISKDKKIRSFARMKKGGIMKSDLFEEQSISEIEQIKVSQISIKIDKEKQRQKERDKEKLQSEDIRSSNNSNDPKEDKDKQKDKKLIKTTWNNIFRISKKIKQKILNEQSETQEREQSDDQNQVKSQSCKSQQISNQLVAQKSDINIENVFGQTELEQYQRINKVSPYSGLPGYKLIHIIIKSYDDLRQESFAMQLLQEFDKIFKLEKLPVKLFPYEVLPLSHQSGIMQCVRDAITIDQLRKKGKGLQQVLDTKAKRKNFIYTLTGYSLVTYFLQVKDRHNGNIMIKNDGSIFHIDYGFFMSNTPGKGVQIQKNLPFKLTNDYVEALGGLKSKNFQQFRKLFFQAFNACRKHQHRILILTKLMYSSFGKTMPCFIKGDQAIQKLEQRFNPTGISNDAQISFYCQNLINSSIDNWRSRWYDKWQYYVQGIFY